MPAILRHGSRALAAASRKASGSRRIVGAAIRGTPLIRRIYRARLRFVSRHETICTLWRYGHVSIAGRGHIREATAPLVYHAAESSSNTEEGRLYVCSYCPRSDTLIMSRKRK